MIKIKALFFIFLFFLIPYLVFALTPEELKNNIKNQISDLEKQLTFYRDGAMENKTRAKTLASELNYLENKINRQELEIKKLTLNFKELDLDIKTTESKIEESSIQITESKKALPAYLKVLNTFGDTNVFEFILSDNDFSAVLAETKSIEDAESQIYNTIINLRKLKITLSDQKDKLSDAKEETFALKLLTEFEKKQLNKTRKEKDDLLKETSGKEKIYQALVQKTSKDITDLKNQLYVLQGNEKLRFEDAIDYAAFAAEKTGIRPAFLLAVLSKESNLGVNVGKGNWQEDMASSKCSKQREAFLEITSKLNLDPDDVPVSRRQSYGYCGGAMGPAQFMPTTWLAYESRIAKLTDNKIPSPWDMKDAFIAAALYLTDAGADTQDTEAEWRAAMKYLAGSNWSKPSLRYYGDHILEMAIDFQNQIDILDKA